MKNISTKSTVFIVTVCFAGVAFWVYYSFFTFHIVKSDPSSTILPTSYKTVEFTFNKNLDSKDYVIKISNKKAKYKITGSKLIVYINKNISTGDTLSLTANNIQSINGDFVDINKEFSVQYVEQQYLPEDRLKQLVDQSDSFEDEYPLVKYLPIQEDEYTINYKYPDSDNKKMPIIISSNYGITTNNPNGIPSDSDVNDYIESLRSSRKKAISYLNNIGFTKDKYQLYFPEPHLIEEFNGELYIAN